MSIINKITDSLAQKSITGLSFRQVHDKIQVTLGQVDLAIVDNNTDQTYLDSKINEILGLIRGRFSGLSSDNDLTNTRSTKDNLFVTSDALENLKLEWKFDVASLFDNPEDLVGARIVGPLGFIQADEETVYFNVGSFGWNVDNGIKDGMIVALNRADGTLKWKIRYSEVSDQAQRRLARKYPDQYNLEIVDNWHRNVTTLPGASFGPITLYKDYIITGDASPTYEFLNNSFFTSLPQVNGGPVLKENWTVTNDNRHLLRTTIMLLDRQTGQLLAVDRFGDSGEGHRTDARGPFDRSAQGFAKPMSAFRMATAFEDGGKDYIICPDSVVDPDHADTYVISDAYAEIPGTTPQSRVAAALANGNISHRYGRVTKFEIIKNDQNVIDLDEIWRRYGHPRRLFAGDVNPYTGQVMETDTEADMLNYYYDGIWGQGIMVDLERRQVGIPGGNGKFMPDQDIIAAWNASPSFDKETKAQSYPKRSFYEWIEKLKKVNTAKKLQEWQNDFALTAKDRWNAILANPGSRAAEYWANSIAVVDLDTGSTKWVFKRQPFDSWQSSTWQFQEFGQSNMPLHMQYMYVGEGGDVDFPMGPLYSKQANIYVAPGKDGSVQGLDPDTGKVLWDTRVGMITSQGTINYGATIVKDHLYVVTMNHNYYGVDFGNLTHKAILDSNNLPVIEDRDPEADGLLTIPFPTNKLVGKPGNRSIPAESLCLVKVNIRTGAIEGVTTLSSPEQSQPDAFSPFSSNISSVNDVILVSGGFSSNVYGIDADTLQKVWTYNTYNDIANFTGDQNFIYNDSAPIAVGRNIYYGSSEAFFAGSTFGKYFYSFKIDQ